MVFRILYVSLFRCKKGIFVTDINEYKNTANSLSVPNLLRPRRTESGVVDAK